MYTARIMTSAFIFNASDLLLLHRSESKVIRPNRWSGIGGHVEPNEISNPADSCLREISEEAGLVSEDLSDFQLRYIVLRQRETEIRQQYVYVGNSVTRRLGATHEGILKWVPVHEIFQLDLVPTTRLLLKHYFETAEALSGVTIGVINATDDREPNVEWVKLRDSEMA